MEFENDVKTVIAEMAEELNKNYSDQKLFDLSLGERLPQKDEIIDFVDELRKVTFPGFFGRENMATRLHQTSERSASAITKTRGI